MTAKRIFLSHWKVVAIPQYRAIHYWIERRIGMKFFSKETCENLFNIKCISTSGLVRLAGGDGRIHDKESVADDWVNVCPPVYTIADFLSDEPYATENCKKVFGDKEPEVTKDAMGGTTISFFNNYEMARMSLVNVPDQEAFILNALEGNK